MIKGTGIDIIELDRVSKLISRQPKIIDRVLTVREKELYDHFNTEKRKIEFFAGRFAGKEAFSKAVGTGIGKLSFQDIEILPDKNGAPVIQSHVVEGDRLFVSISHSEAYAVAQVIIEVDSA
ncbi:holo-[acyl-carrier-protein] synthase [Gracilibacillus ureilyticus]|uniref:Holo-[acyl-carrier-protein] synthase n=1 Tax=Gracilibacillus ureilyticus TaxID=531814 RepID=A0A1H9NQ07_9BACI|nr:holo-ACP synthase [Gracilibacillus ureilyticus]SER38070.1 holo-[acyl-carrier-protein] synthase [Gracilibacillus ureilyticus]